MAKKYNFVLLGVGGYIAPRHLQAIKDTGNNLLAALDPKDSVGIIDRYFLNADFFTEFERFDRYAEKRRRMAPEQRIDFVSICTPNYLHDAHIRFALRIGANALCEKPLVLNPWNIDALKELERESGKKIYTVLQLRLHPAIKALKGQIEKEEKKIKHEINLTYITPRGNWYLYSWKGDDAKSGGLATNIGIHFFDMLIWIFGPVKKAEVHYSDPRNVAGFLELENANVKWFLSIEAKFSPNQNKTFRSITVDGKEFEFSEGFTELHTEVYKDIMNGGGFGLDDVRPSIQLAHDIRKAKTDYHVFPSHKHDYLTKLIQQKLGEE